MDIGNTNGLALLAMLFPREFAAAMKEVEAEFERDCDNPECPVHAGKDPQQPLNLPEGTLATDLVRIVRGKGGAQAVVVRGEGQDGGMQITLFKQGQQSLSMILEYASAAKRDADFFNMNEETIGHAIDLASRRTPF